MIGRDTRLSGTMLEAAMIAGITSTGRNVVLLGVVPTPCVAAVTVSIGAAAGVMISASHNPIEDNGIKFFGPDGFKLSDAVEDEIGERLNDPTLPRPTHTGVGIATARAGTRRTRTSRSSSPRAPISAAGRSSSMPPTARRFASGRWCSNGSARA